tara:strand:- start:118 stop:690 length:573 start_codon:yes stop_codon:yes gene_type:complete
MLACSLYGQQKQPIYIVAGDTLTNPYVDLSEVVVIPSIKFKSYDDYVSYYRLQRRTIKVYPYAQLAAERLTVLNQRLANIKRKRAKKRYAKQVERYLEGEFKDELKKLTRWEGRILIKLIHRETGFTAHTLIKKLRNGWRAFIYQTTAKMFDINLKTAYNPIEVEEDALIEYVLQKAFAEGVLKPHNEKK